MTKQQQQNLEARVKYLETRLGTLTNNSYISRRVLTDIEHLRQEQRVQREDLMGVRGLLGLLTQKLKLRLVTHVERKEWVKDSGWWPF